jgi:hypothetical protein
LHKSDAISSQIIQYLNDQELKLLKQVKQPPQLYTTAASAFSDLVIEEAGVFMMENCFE